MVEHVRINNKPTTRHEEERLIDKIIRPALGNLKLSKLTPARVRSWHSELACKKVSGNRALAHLQRACRIAIEHELLEMNPSRTITRHKERARNRFYLMTKCVGSIDAPFNGACRVDKHRRWERDSSIGPNGVADK